MNFKRKSAASLNDQRGAKCFARLGSKIAEPFRGNIENKYLDGDLQKTSTSSMKGVKDSIDF
jgi:hypothetical protein